MSALLAPARSPERESGISGGGPALQEVLDCAWQRLDAGLPVTCVVCGGRMEPEPGARGRCRDCGAELS